MAEKRRINLTLTLNSALHRQAWDIIKKIPAGQRTEQLCRIICSYRDSERQSWLSGFRQIVREELAEAKINYRTNESVKEAEPRSVSDDVLGFLRSLQEGDGIG